MKTRNKANKGVKTLEITKDILDYYLFRESGRKSKFEAFLDIFFNNDKLPDGKEGIKTTFGELAKRWCWNKPSVKRFLVNLEKEGWIKLKISRMNIEITDVNFGSFSKKISKIINASKSDMLQTGVTDVLQLNTLNSVNYEGGRYSCVTVEGGMLQLDGSKSDGYEGVCYSLDNKKDDVTVMLQLDDFKSDSYEGGRYSDVTVEQDIYNIYNNNNNNIYNINNNNNIYPKNFSFENFWNLYDKKVGLKSKIEKKYNKLTLKDKMLIFYHILKYKEAVPNKKYRKNPETYLNNKSWLDEIIYDKKEVKEVKNTYPGNILQAVIE